MFMSQHMESAFSVSHEIFARRAPEKINFLHNVVNKNRLRRKLLGAQANVFYSKHREGNVQESLLCSWQGHLWLNLSLYSHGSAAVWESRGFQSGNGQGSGLSANINVLMMILCSNVTAGNRRERRLGVELNWHDARKMGRLIHVSVLIGSKSTNAGTGCANCIGCVSQSRRSCNHCWTTFRLAAWTSWRRSWRRGFARRDGWGCVPEFDTQSS